MYHYIIRISIVFILSIFLFPQLSQGNNIPYIKAYNKTDYLGGQANRGFVQDENGVLYIANSEGLLVFDGNDFNLFPLENKTQILSLGIDNNERIFVGGQGEFGYFLPNSDGGLDYVSLKSKVPENHKNFSDIRKVCITEEGVYFKALLKVYFWSRNDDSITVYETGSVIDYIEFINGVLYIDDNDQGLLILDKGKLKEVKGGDILSKKEVTSLVEWNNKILLTTWENGIFVLTDSGIEPFETELPTILKQQHIKTALINPENELLLGTVLGGIYALDRNGEFLYSINKENGLKNNAVQYLFYDQFDNLWVGLETGFNYIKNSIPLRFIYPDAKQELIGYAARVFKDKLYLATNVGLYCKDLKDTNKLDEQEFELVKNSIGLCWNLSEVNDELYLNMHKGLFKIEGDIAIEIRKTSVGSWVTLPLEGDKDKILEGTYLGINIYDQKGNINTLETGISSRIIEQTKNKIWVSHDYRGVYRINLDDEYSKVLSIDYYNKEKGFPSDIDVNVSSVNDEIVFTSEKGIFKYDQNLDSIVPHKSLNQIFGMNSDIKRLVHDNFGRLWFVEGKKVGYINLNDFLSLGKINKKYLPKLEGLLVERFQHIYPYSEDKTYFGIENGFIEYQINGESKENFQFKAKIDNVGISKSLDSLVYSSAYLATNNNSKDQLEYSINYELNSICFNYSTNFFSDLENMLFSSKLVGYEDNWIDWNKERKRTFTNLPPGEYEFILKAKNYQQLESETVSLQFRIAAPWYMSTIAKICFLLMALLGLFLLWKIPSSNYKKQTQDLKAQQEQKLNIQKSQYDEKIKESEKELVDIKNEKLTSEVNFKNRELASLTMHLVQKRETLAKINEELSKIEKMKENVEIKNLTRRMVRKIEQDLKFDNNWSDFEKYFDQVHADFLSKLREKYPQLTNKDYRLCAFLRMNLPSKEIATLLNITTRSVEVSRHRLRKRLDLSREENLVDFIMKI